MDTLEKQIEDCMAWTDEQLTTELKAAAVNEKASLMELLVRLREFDHRELSERKGYPSAFEYCRSVLGYSRSGAGRRVAVARAAKKFPSLLAMIGNGELYLTGAAMLAGHLTSENHRRLLGAARGKSEDEIARLLAGLSPRPSSKDRIRIVAAPPSPELRPPDWPDRQPQAEPSAALQSGLPAVIDLFGQLSTGTPDQRQEAYAVRFEASRATIELLRRAQELLRHRFPRGELDGIVQFALKILVATIDRDIRKDEQTHKPHTSKTAVNKALPRGSGASGDIKDSTVAKRSRYVPEHVKQTVWERDGGRCAFIGEEGVRCRERAWIEFDHKTPYARGGASDLVENIRLLCRRHNQLMGRLMFKNLNERRPP